MKKKEEEEEEEEEGKKCDAALSERVPVILYNAKRTGPQISTRWHTYSSVCEVYAAGAAL